MRLSVLTVLVLLLAISVFGQVPLTNPVRGNLVVGGSVLPRYASVYGLGSVLFPWRVIRGDSGYFKVLVVTGGVTISNAEGLNDGFGAYLSGSFYVKKTVSCTLDGWRAFSGKVALLDPDTSAKFFRIYGSLCGVKKALFDTIAVSWKVGKHIFGNSGANLTDTILYVGLIDSSCIAVGVSYRYDSGASTWNSLTIRFAVTDTFYIYRQAITDPDSIENFTIFKKKVVAP